MLSHPDAELACLGACLLDPDAARLVAETIRPHEWTRDQYSLVHAGVRRLVSRGEPVDCLTLYIEICKQPHEGIDAAWLVGLEAAVPTAANVRHYAALVHDAASRRLVRTACERTLKGSRTRTAPLSETVSHLAEDLDAATGGDPDTGKACLAVPLSAALKSWQGQWVGGRPPQRVSFPIPKLNALLGGGLEAGELAYMGARAGVGKTSLALETARSVAQGGQGVLVISREMTLMPLVCRLLSQQSRLPALTVRSGTFDALQYPSAHGRL